MNEFLENLKREANANPILALGVAAGLLGAAAQFLNASGSVRSKRAYAKMAENFAKKASK